MKLKEVDEIKVASLSKDLKIHNSLARILVGLGIDNREDARRFLFPTFQDLYSSALLPDMEKALERIEQAIRAKERILIWGHEDLDGITSVVTIYEVLKDLRADVLYFIPQKYQGKYGLNTKKIHQLGANLVISVDSGITNFSEVLELANSGIDTVILEHHEVVENKLPPSVANVDAKRKETKYPFRELAGGGTVLKTAFGLVKRILGIPEKEFFSIKPDLLGLITLGTIADRVPLIDENRILVKMGLENLKKSSRLIIKTLLESLEIEQSTLTVGKIFSQIVPIFGSVQGMEGCQIFLEKDDPLKILNIIKKLKAEASAYKEEAKQVFEMVLETVVPAEGIIIIKRNDIPVKYLGNCAGKLREYFGLPVIMIGKQDDVWMGEGRGVDGVDLVELLKDSGDYFIDYGGHKKACGFSILEKNLEQFIARALEYASKNFSKINLGTSPNTEEALAILPFSEIDDQFCLLEPYGEANPPPLLFAPKTELVYRESKIIYPQNPQLDITMSPQSAMSGFKPEGIFDILYTLDENLAIRIKRLIVNK